MRAISLGRNLQLPTKVGGVDLQPGFRQLAVFDSEDVDPGDCETNEREFEDVAAVVDALSPEVGRTFGFGLWLDDRAGQCCQQGIEPGDRSRTAVG